MRKIAIALLVLCATMSWGQNRIGAMGLLFRSDGTLVSTLTPSGPTNLNSFGFLVDSTGAVVVTTSGALAGVSLTGASSGNTVTLLNYGPSASAIVGTGAAANLFSYTMPGNTLGVNKCIRFTAVFNHSTGTASVAYQWNFGSLAITGWSSANTALFRQNVTVCNKGATNVQDVFQDNPINTAGNVNNSMQAPAGAVDTTAPVAVTFTFNVANTDQVTPKMFTAELLQ